jgi:hypothetical protein
MQSKENAGVQMDSDLVVAIKQRLRAFSGVAGSCSEKLPQDHRSAGFGASAGLQGSCKVTRMGEEIEFIRADLPLGRGLSCFVATE